MLYTRCIHVIMYVVYMLYTCCIHVSCMLYTCCIHVVSTLYTCFMYVVYMLYACFMYVVYMLYTCWIPVIQLHHSWCVITFHSACINLNNIPLPSADRIPHTQQIAVGIPCAFDVRWRTVDSCNALAGHQMARRVFDSYLELLQNTSDVP